MAKAPGAYCMQMACESVDAKPAGDFFGQLSAVVHARNLMLSTKLALGAHPVGKSPAADRHNLRRTEANRAHTIGNIILVQFVQCLVELVREFSELIGRSRELNEVTMMPRFAGLLGKDRADVKINDQSARCLRGQAHGFLDLLAN